MKSKFLSLLLVLFAVAFPAADLSAQIDGVDNDYNPVLSSHLTTGPVGEYVQGDGEFLSYGNFTHVNGSPLMKVARFGIFGNVGLNLSCRITCDFTVTSVIPQTDGKVVIAGYSERANGIFPKTIRIHSNNLPDTTFVDPWAGFASVPSQSRKANVVAIQADGKIYATLLSEGPSITSRSIYRLNTDGTIDSGFSIPVFNEGPGFRQSLAGISVLADGRVFIFGNTPYGGLAKINADGSKDNVNFSTPELTFPPGSDPGDPMRPFINSFGVQADGKYLFTGQFDTVNAAAKTWVARLNTDGSLDTAYSPDPAFTNAGNKLIATLNDNKSIFIRRESGKKIARYNADGTLDNTYSAPDEITNVVRAASYPGGKVLLYGERNNSGVNEYMKLSAGGAFDSPFFRPNFINEIMVNTVYALPDGKSILIGNFTRVNGIARDGFARLNADGSLDNSFDMGSPFASSARILAIAVQNDGKLLLSVFTSLPTGINLARLVRINLDGSIDGSFNPSVPDGVEAIVVRPDGKILIGGYFDTINSVPRVSLALLNTDGTLDTSLAVTIGTNSQIEDIFLPGDGRMMIAGGLFGIPGATSDRLLRLNADGSVDTTFNYTEGDLVNQIEMTSDGKFIVKGLEVNRLNSNGSLDTGFNWPSLNGLRSMVPRADGTVIIGGFFSTPRQGIARLTQNGSFDLLFDPESVSGPLPNWMVNVQTMSAQPDGKILIGGNFVQAGSQSRVALARLVPAPAIRVTPFDFDGDGRADVSVTRQSDFWWYQLTGINYNYSGVPFGSPGDKVVAADYDGDGRTDHAIFRPSTADWWWLGSADGQPHFIHWGIPGDTPVVGDFNGDGKYDVGVRRNGNNWFLATTSGVMINAGFYGQPGDIPVIGDYDGNGKDDLAVFRPSSGEWFSSVLGLGFMGTRWGLSSDIPVPADYDGDGKTDLAVFRPSEGNWYIRYSTTLALVAMHFGLDGDKPVPADYDGDGKADLAVFRPSSGYWFFLRSMEGFTGFPWGISTDIPTPGALLRSTDPPRPISVMRQKK